MIQLYSDIKGNGPPTKSTPGAVGQIYIDRETGLRYECIEAFVQKGYKVNREIYTWEEKGLDPDFLATDAEVEKAIDNLREEIGTGGGGGGGITTETDPTVPDWAKAPEKPKYTADEVFFDSDLILTEQFGKYKPVNGKVRVPAENKSVQATFLDAYSEDKNPTITQPSVGISSGTAKAYEVGTKVTPAYTGSFSAGKYEYGPDDTGVTPTAWEATNTVTSEKKTTQNGSFAEYTVPDGGNYKITLKCTYSDGAIPKTALEAEYPAGQIKAATKTATSGTIAGYRNSFYGTLTDKNAELTSALIRGLAQKSGKALANGNTVTVNVPVGAMAVVFAYPATLKELSSVKDVNGMNAEILPAFTAYTVSVEGANGYTAIDYRVYVQRFANANDKANTYTFKI